ncbi:MAG: nucleotidyl transferase AbiEii/AbiGii toxin family protein [Rubrobacter sp.]|nr:nucleotidyl transferase AbiEii/AbiGii toxin family protein [Rubrobacter sp.]
MRASVFYNIVTRGGGAEIEELLRLLDEASIRYCVIGGQAVNHYVEPLVSLDLDLVVATDQLAAAERLLSGRYAVRRFPHSLNVNLGQSDLRVQVQTDPRYGDFVDRAVPGDVLGIPMYVAAARDVLRGKVWAAQDSSRRPSKRQKDLVDIARLIEAYPDLRTDVPADLLRRIEE